MYNWPNNNRININNNNNNNLPHFLNILKLYFTVTIDLSCRFGLTCLAIEKTYEKIKYVQPVAIKTFVQTYEYIWSGIKQTTEVITEGASIAIKTFVETYEYIWSGIKQTTEVITEGASIAIKTFVETYEYIWSGIKQTTEVITEGASIAIKTFVETSRHIVAADPNSADQEQAVEADDASAPFDAKFMKSWEMRAERRIYDSMFPHVLNKRLEENSRFVSPHLKNIEEQIEMGNLTTYINETIGRGEYKVYFNRALYIHSHFPEYHPQYKEEVLKTCKDLFGSENLLSCFSCFLDISTRQSMEEQIKMGNLTNYINETIGRGEYTKYFNHALDIHSANPEYQEEILKTCNYFFEDTSFADCFHRIGDMNILHYLSDSEL